MTVRWRIQIALCFLASYCLAVQSGIVQEFLPRALSAYGDGLENAQILQIHIVKPGQPMSFVFAANITKGCSAANITLFLRYDGLPIVNVFNASYPNFTWVYKPIDYEENFLSDGVHRRLELHALRPSTVLFGVVFFLEDTSRIQQQGLTKSCTTLFWGRAEALPPESSSDKEPLLTNLIEDEFLPVTINVTSENQTVASNAIELVRKNYMQILTTKWVVDQGSGDGNLTATADSVLVLQPNDISTILSLTIISPTDVGGTLDVEIKFEKAQHNSSVFGCITYGEADCEKGYRFSANSSISDQKAKAIIPYPLAGKWFLFITANCTEVNGSDCERNISVKMHVSLLPCQEGACGSHGRCIQYLSAGLVYSACVCTSGFAGWSCTDDSDALSTAVLLTSVLLLTTSNLFFIPAVMLALRRGYYPQCMMYFTTMFFSSFYHACDQTEFNYCLMPYMVLQFGDFYSALASVWLTAIIVAEPQVSQQISSTLSLAGTVGIAMAVHYNATSFASFTIPIVCGLLLIAVCWIQHSCKQRACYPGKSYCFKAVVPCLFFSIVGLVCFAFLETEDNYFYVHSIWHISIALAILFVMPAKSHGMDVTKP